MANTRRFKSLKRAAKMAVHLVVSVLLLQSQLGFAAAAEAERRLAAASESAVMDDIRGHCAEKQLSEWLNRGWLSGYADGTIRPNQPVTRAEFASMVNRAFGFEQTAETRFRDVSGEWFAPDVAKAVAAGYISGYPDDTFRPRQWISREEAAVIAVRLLGLHADDVEGALQPFSDRETVASWSRSAVAAVAEAGIMNGYPDGTFRPRRSITRVEAVVVLDGMRNFAPAQGFVIRQPGVYGSGDTDNPQVVHDDVAVLIPDVTLKNMVIHGDLLLGEGIGEGDVMIQNVTVHGVTTIQGGGSNSIHIGDSNLGEVVIDKKDGNIRVVVTGKTFVREVILQSGAKLEEVDLEDEGFGHISISLTSEGKVILAGDFASVSVEAPGVEVELTEGSVDQLNVGEKADGANVIVQESASVELLVLNAPVQVKGQGTVAKAEVNAEGASLEKEPNEMVISEGVTSVKVGDNVVTPPASVTPAPVSGGGSPGGGGNTGPGSGDDSGEPGDDNEEPGDDNEEVPVADLILDTDPITLKIGDTHSIEVTVDPDHATNKAVEWLSADPDVAVVDEGTITAVGKGTTQIVVRSESNDQIFKTVTVNVVIEYVSMDVESPIRVTVPWGTSKADIIQNHLNEALSTVQVTGSQNITDSATVAWDIPDFDSNAGTYDAIGTVTLPEYWVWPDEPVNIKATVAVEPIQVSASVETVAKEGFKLLLEPGVPGLVKGDLTLLDEKSDPVTAFTLEREDEAGKVYRIEADLARGKPYTLELSKPNYAFDPESIVFSGPALEVNAGIHLYANSFIMTFDTAVPGLDESHVTIQPAIPIRVTALPGNTAYRIEATGAFQENAEYTFSLNHPDYQFNGTLVHAYELPMKVLRANEEDFVLHLNAPVELNPSQLVLKRNGSRPGSEFTFASVSDDKRTYTIRPYGFFIDGGVTYELSLDGLPEFGVVTFRVAHTIWVNLLSDVTTDGFTFYVGQDFEAPLEKEYMVLTPLSGGDPAEILGITRRVTNIIAYEIHAKLEPGKVYIPVINHPVNTLYYLNPEAEKWPAAKIAVNAGVINQTLEGFELTFNKPIPGLDAQHFNLMDLTANQPATPLSVTEQDEGYTYRFLVDLVQHHQYRLTFKSAGTFDASLYLFAPSALEFTALGTPAAIAEVRVIAGNRFEVVLDQAITGIAADSFSVCEEGAEEPACLEVESFETNDDQTFEIVTSEPLVRGKRYTFAVQRAGYEIAAKTGVELPPLEVEVVSVDGSTTVVTVVLDQPVEGMLPSDFVLTRLIYNNTVAITSATTNDGGITYQLNVGTPLNPGQRYKLTLAKAGYTFLNEPEFTAIAHVTAEVIEQDATGFTFRLSRAVPELWSGSIRVTSLDGYSTWTMDRQPSLRSSTDGGYTYRVAGVMRGGNYRLAFNSPEGYRIDPVDFVMPVLEVDSTIESFSKKQIIVQLDPSIMGLTVKDFVLQDEQGNDIPIASFSAHPGDAVYFFDVNLREGLTYHLRPEAQGFDFGTGDSLYVPIAVTPKPTAWPEGILIELSHAIPDMTKEQITVKPVGGAVGDWHRGRHQAG